MGWEMNKGKDGWRKEDIPSAIRRRCGRGILASGFYVH